MAHAADEAEEFPVSRYFVDARMLSIIEGADETLSLKIIARRLLRGERHDRQDPSGSPPRTRGYGRAAGLRSRWLAFAAASTYFLGTQVVENECEAHWVAAHGDTHCWTGPHRRFDQRARLEPKEMSPHV